MPSFLELPRELRDAIYISLLTHTTPLPLPIPPPKFMNQNHGDAGHDLQSPHFRKLYSPSAALSGEFGCAYALAKPPPGYANFMAANRQVRAEMSEAMAWVRKKGEGAVHLECVAEDESWFWFGWVGAPLVTTTTTTTSDSLVVVVPAWMDGAVGKYLSYPLAVVDPVLRATGLVKPATQTTTRIETLRLDVRIVGSRAKKRGINTAGSIADRTGWAVCAALKRVFDHGRFLAVDGDAATSTLRVGELVLNVVPPVYAAPSNVDGNLVAPPTLDEDFPLDATAEGVVHPRTVARELAEVWSRIWAGDGFRGTYYAGLLEGIGRVRVCVDGERYRVRELGKELQRGRLERERFRERYGWTGD